MPANSLTIVIPALNEEEAIGGTISRCLEAVDHIKETGSLSEVELIVVSDGSTDGTVDVVRSFGDSVKLIIFEENQGYGAAIKEGFRQGKGTLVSFLDADGTCDPRYFAEMCRISLTEKADVVLGSRLGPDSHMPKVRRFGNHLFALLLGFLCGRSITDTASGMRVIQRSALPYLYPLPDGLHFTPSMSARALLGGLRVVEIPMTYHERIGRSKLSVVTDGLRFLGVILQDVLCYRPERLFLIGFTICLLIGLLLAARPVEYYALNHSVEEWMIYRFLVVGLLGTVGFQLLGGAAVAYRMSTLGPRRVAEDSFWPPLLAKFFEGKPQTWFVGFFFLLSMFLLWPGIFQYVTSLQVTLHWSRFATGVFGLVLTSQALITGIVMRILRLWKAQLACRDTLDT